MPILRSLSTDRLRGRGVIRPEDEEHRSATPLELLFDLAFVVAISQASAALHHELVTGHVVDGVLAFTMAFFAIWWAWMNFTWFASAHDSDDVPYRLLTLVQMAGALVMAAGIAGAVESGDFTVPTIGYVIMRAGLIPLWLRVARDEPDGRTRALRYAGGLAALQVLWITRLALPEEAAVVAFVVFGVGELLVPLWAERAADHAIFHPEHIEERYGLFTIIVLGESMISAVAGFQVELESSGLTSELLVIGVAALVLAFSAWWLYFDHPGHLTPTPEVAFRWGYAHVVLFAALAATGAGVHVAAEAVGGHASARVAAMSVAVPAACYLLGLALVMGVTGFRLTDRRLSPKLGGAAVILVLGALAPVTVAVAGAAAVFMALALAMVMADDAGRLAETG